MSAEDRFRAAVNVIRSLPKNGSYQPSNELMLRFYAFFKQATEGPNKSPKPSFWEVVKKAKWEAWNRLGNMPKEDAMNAYVDELNKIVETMAYTENVADFLSSLDSFYARVPQEQLEMCIGPALEKVRSLPNSPLASREASPVRAAPDPSLPRPILDDEDDDDFYLDSVETVPMQESRSFAQSESTLNTTIVSNGNHVQDTRTSEILMKSLISLRKDMDEVNEKMKRIEQRQKMAREASRQLFGNMSLKTVVFIVGWPVIVHLALMWLSKKKQALNHALGHR